MQICRKRSDHPLLTFDGLIPGHVVLPAHPHEGVIIPTTASQQVLLSSYSITSGREQITAILDEVPGRGFVLHHSIQSQRPNSKKFSSQFGDGVVTDFSASETVTSLLETNYRMRFFCFAKGSVAQQRLQIRRRRRWHCDKFVSDRE